MIERLHRHVHSQLSKYITSIRQRQAFLSLENGFSFKKFSSVFKRIKWLQKALGYLYKKTIYDSFSSFICSFGE